jgi:hypothetical protein
MVESGVDVVTAAHFGDVALDLGRVVAADTFVVAQTLLCAVMKLLATKHITTTPSASSR